MGKISQALGQKREVILLVVIAVAGAVGLLILQFARKTPASRTDERSMVQSGAQKSNAAALSAPIQTITGDLVVRDEEYPEVGQPFTFRMTNFAQGATYELDPGDGSGRRAFQDGTLQYTYSRSGDFQITLWAKYERQEVKLKTITKRVKVPPRPEKVEIAPFIDN
ncbi:MAG: hypothetical protein JNJ90_14655 [Saprospiraceae bacterium]|jgi:hypothetical protein|nr:hypothetical protein [Saprospiraceae bacterium]